MAKIKIKDFKGIYTNIDENDNDLELVTESQNFFHKRGFLEFEPRALKSNTGLPDITDFAPGYSWEWETGIYTTLSTDVLSTDEDSVPAKYDITVLIAKATDSGTYHRLVYLYDGSTWIEMSNYSSPKVANIPIIDIKNFDGVDFSQSLFSTTIDGTTHFQVENGRLKIYLPHDCFWLGKLNRKIFVKDEKQRWTVGSGDDSNHPYFDYEHNYWYIDRLTEAWDHSLQYVNHDGFNVGQYPPLAQNTDLTSLICAKPDGNIDVTRRTGLLYDLEIETDATHIVDSKLIDIHDPHDWRARHDPPTGYRAIRTSIYDDETKEFVRNPDIPFPNNPEIWSFPLDLTNTSFSFSGQWIFDAADTPNINIFFTQAQAKAFRPVGIDWDAVPGYVAAPNGQGVVWNQNDLPQIVSGMSHSIPLFNWLTNEFEYGGDGEVQDLGWLTTENHFNIVATLVLDDREEIPVSSIVYKPDISATYVLRIKDIHFPWDINKRMTRLRFYHRLEEEADLELVKEFDLLTAESSTETFEFSNASKEGISLSANIGFLWDYFKHPGDLKIITGFKDFVTESGVSIGISSRDEVAIYHSTFGGGNLMPDLVYDDNRIAITGISSLTAVGNADGRLMAFTANTAYAINPEEISGVLAFNLEDTVEVGVKNKNDVANIQGGLVAHTQHGIYITNGFETQLVSEAIDDLVTQYYSTGRIYYNRFKHEIYYKPTNAEDLYRFRLKDAVWEHINKTTSSGDVEGEEASA